MSRFDKIEGQLADPTGGKPNEYWKIYERIVSGIDAESELRILEIGVGRGGGLVSLGKIFPNSEIFGIDNNHDGDVQEAIETSGRPIFVGSQTDVQFILDVEKKAGPFDIIIDDASHVSMHQIITFETLFPKLKKGGMYIVEDTHTSYLPSYDGGYSRGTFMNYCKLLSDMLYIFWWRNIEYLHAPQIDLDIISNISNIAIYPNVVAIQKGESEWEGQIGRSMKLHDTGNDPILPEISQEILRRLKSKNNKRSKA